MNGEALRPTAKTLEETFTKTLQFWNGFFATQPVEACRDMAGTATSQLDQLLEWQNVLHAPCLVNGYGLWSEVKGVEFSEDDVDYVEEELNTRITFNLLFRRGEFKNTRGVCRGFVAFCPAGQERPELCYLFETGGWESEIHNTLSIEGRHRMYVKPSESSIVPMTEFETPFLPSPSEEVNLRPDAHHILSMASGELVKLVSSTGFRRQKSKHQFRLIDDLISTAENESMIRGADALLEPQYGYTSEILESGEVDYLPVALGGYCLEGTCLGLSVLGQKTVMRGAIRSDKDLLSKCDGLSLGVALDEAVLLPDRVLGVGTVVHLPLSGQTFECVIVSNVFADFDIDEPEPPDQTQTSTV